MIDDQRVDGVVPGEISGWIAEETGYHPDHVASYLIDKYKIKTHPTGPQEKKTAFISAISKTLEKAFDKVLPVVDLESANGLRKAAKALEREGVPEGVAGGLPKGSKGSDLTSPNGEVGEVAETTSVPSNPAKDKVGDPPEIVSNWEGEEIEALRRKEAKKQGKITTNTNIGIGCKPRPRGTPITGGGLPDTPLVSFDTRVGVAGGDLPETPDNLLGVLPTLNDINIERDASRDICWGGG